MTSDGGGGGGGERATEREVGGSSRGGSAGEAGRALAPQLIVYGTLLQTRKPYLLNCVSVAALPALLLAALRVDTSADCRRLVVDDWLLVTVDSSERSISVATYHTTQECQPVRGGNGAIFLSHLPAHPAQLREHEAEGRCMRPPRTMSSSIRLRVDFS